MIASKFESASLEPRVPFAVDELFQPNGRTCICSVGISAFDDQVLEARYHKKTYNQSNRQRLIRFQAPWYLHVEILTLHIEVRLLFILIDASPLNANSGILARVVPS